MDYTFSYSSRKFICAYSYSSVHAHGEAVRGGNFKHFKTSVERARYWDILLLCHKFAYQIVVEGQGHFV